MNIKLIRIIDYYVGIILIQLLRIFKFLKPKKAYPHFKPDKILILKFFGFGNIILPSPVFKIMKKSFPKAEIHYLTLSNNKGSLCWALRILFRTENPILLSLPAALQRVSLSSPTICVSSDIAL